MNNDENKKPEEKENTTTDNVPTEQAQDDTEQSAPTDKKSDSPVDTKPEPASEPNGDMMAKLDGFDKKADSIIDMLTSILNRLPETGDSQENDDPDDSEKGSDTAEDFENLV